MRLKYLLSGPESFLIPGLAILVRFLLKLLLWSETHCIPADIGVFKTSSGLLRKVTMSYDQTGRRHDALKKTSYLKTSNLRRLEDIQFTTS